MKRLIVGLLAIFGLVPLRRYTALTHQAEEAKKASREWKATASRATARVGALEAEIKRQRQHLEKSENYRAKSRQRGRELEHLRTLLATAERELLVAREHLMAIEVKLDILEGAANVLDIRTRAAIAKPSSQTSAPA